MEGNDLTRLLLNIPKLDVALISNMLGFSTFIEAVDKLSEENKTQVLDRISNTTILP
jgi:hypothetical protein